MMRPMFSFDMKSVERNGARDCRQKGVGGVLVAAQSAEEGAHLGRRRFQRCELSGELVHGPHAFVPCRFVSRQQLLERALAEQPRLRALAQQPGIDERVADALRGNGMAVP